MKILGKGLQPPTKLVLPQKPQPAMPSGWKLPGKEVDRKRRLPDVQRICRNLLPQE
nr:MAG TPA: hypothetical protein [Inoviridae sp.]